MNFGVTQAPTKAAVRREMGRRRAELDPAWVRTASDQIASRCRALAQLIRAKRVGLYTAMPCEVQTDSIKAACLAGGQRVAVPACAGEVDDYRFSWIGPGTRWVTGPLGIAEPAEPEWVPAGALDVILVPCVAFDRLGTRLGHGLGAYDRLLRGQSGMNVGLAFAFQQVAVIPSEPHDVPLHRVLTETEEFDFNPEGHS